MSATRFFGFLLGKWPMLLLACLMSGLGYGLYEWLEPVERWRASLDETNIEFVTLDAKGQFTLECVNSSKGHFQKRDVATGAIVRVFPAKEGEFEFTTGSITVPVENRYWAGLPSANRGILDLLDLESGVTRRIPIKDVAVNEQNGGQRRFMLSPRNDIVAISHWDQQHHPDGAESWIEILKVEIHLYALPTGEFLERIVIDADPGKQAAERLKKKGEQLLLTKFDWLQFSPDGSYFIFPSTHDDELCFRLWDVAKRRLAGIVPVADWDMEPNANGRFLLTANDEPTTKLWDLANLDRPIAICELPVQRYRASFAPDARTLAAMVKDEIVFWDTATGKELGRVTVPSQGELYFSPDGTLLATFGIGNGENTPYVHVLDTATHKILWKGPNRTADTGMYGHEFYGEQCRSVVLTTIEPKRCQTDLRDARTGEIRATFVWPHGEGTSAEQSEDGRRLLVRAKSARNAEPQNWYVQWINRWLLQRDDVKEARTEIRIFDLPTRREVFRLRVPHDIEAHLFAPDGATLIMAYTNGRDRPHIHCYDLPARYPWLKIIGIPMGLSVFCLVAARCWRWRRDKWVRKATPVAPPEGPLTAG